MGIQRRAAAWWLGAVPVALVIGLVSGEDALAASATCAAGNVRWSSSSNRIYVSGENTVCTLSDLDELKPGARIDPVAGVSGGWWLGSNVVLENGATLRLYGTAAGGDVDELRLKSNNTGAADDIVYVRAQWGTIDIKGTRVSSWDGTAGGPDIEYGKYKRSYLQARSYLDGGGVPRQSRMDIVDSDVGYLGYYGAEAYGLSWKVIGNTADIFDKVDVRGDVRGSRIHHNYFGVYTYGAYGMNLQDNEVDNNVMYGLDPHDNSDKLVIERNNAHHNGSHGIIASRYCDQLIIRDNESHHNGGNGIMLHRDSNDSVVENNVLYGNGDAALALFESHRNVLSNNRADGNRRGVRISMGSADNLIKDNTFSDNTDYGIYFYKGSDQPAQGDGRPKNNTLANNVIDGSGTSGLKLNEGDNNLIRNNAFINGGKDLVLMDARGNVLEGNTVTGNTNYGLQLRRGSSNNKVVGNTIVNSRDGVRLSESSNSNELEGNVIRGNSQYAVYIENSSNNVFRGNVTEGNGKNYYYARAASNNEIEDTPEASVKVGDFVSSMTVVDSANHVFETKRRVPTVMALAQSLMKLTRYITTGVIDVTQVDFVAVPTDSEVVVLLREGYVLGETLQWAATAEGATGVEYRIGGWEPNEQYAVMKNGEYLLTAAADGSGRIIFSDSVAGGAEVNYRIERASATFSPALFGAWPEPIVLDLPTPEPSPEISASPSPDASPSPISTTPQE